jgi:stearoyl-CoA desaturase (delta-9 desaturase)
VIEFLVLFLIFYIWHGLGVTVGYHRLLSHRAFACPKFVEYFFVLAGYLAFEGSPIWWATIHRAHHRWVDTPLDPHAPKYGIYYAHVGWLGNRSYASHIDPQTQAKDLFKDPLYVFLEQGGNLPRAHALVFSLGLAFRLLLLLAFGWVPALASLLAGVAVLQIPLMLNVVCHLPRLGYKNFALDDDSVNVWWVSVLAMGEGWHNNHHASPGSARSGFRWFEFDLSWLIICAMKRLGLAGQINDMKRPGSLPSASPLAGAASVIAGMSRPLATIPVASKTTR